MTRLLSYVVHEDRGRFHTAVCLRERHCPLYANESGRIGRNVIQGKEIFDRRRISPAELLLGVDVYLASWSVSLFLVSCLNLLLT
jgi:hypothetical protein